MRAAHQALHYHASQANLALESDAWASLVDPRNARAAPGVARRTFGRAHPPCGRQRVRGAHLSRARDFAADSFARQRSTPLSRARFRGGFVRASEERTSLARTRLPRVRFWDFPKVPLRPSQPCPSPPPRCLPPRALASRTARSAAMPSTRATRRFSSARAPTPRRRRCASTSTASRDPRVASPPSATLLAIDEATSIDTRAPTARVTTITSVATLTRDDAPLARFSASCPAPPRTAPGRAPPILASSSAPASARAAISPRPAPQPPSIPSHTPATASSASSPRSFATTSPSSVSRTVASSFEDRTSTSNVPRAPPSCIPRRMASAGARGASDFRAQLPDDADERLNDQTADTDGIRTRARTRRAVFAAYDNGSWARLRRDARGEWRVSSSSPGPHPEFADPARLVPLRERSRRARRPPRVGAAARLGVRTARPLYLSSPPPSGERGRAPTMGPSSRVGGGVGDAASGRKALGKHALATRDSPRASHGRGAVASRNSPRRFPGTSVSVSGGDDCVAAAWRPRFDPTASRIVDMACVNHTRTPAATRALARSPSTAVDCSTAGADKNVRARCCPDA